MHQIRTLLLLGMESAPAKQLSAADWLPTLEKRARAGRGLPFKKHIVYGTQAQRV